MQYWQLGQIPILMYHSIDNIPGDRLSVAPADFAAQLSYLRDNGVKTLTLAQLAHYWQEKQPLPRKRVILTFDDGYLDNYTNALPLLQEYGMQAAVFPVAGSIGKSNDWEEYAGKTSRPTMGWEELRGWLAAGMEVGVHTVSHCSLSSLASEHAIIAELEASRQLLKANLQLEPEFVCYPYGDFDERVRRAVADCGFQGALAILNDTPWFTADRYALQRLPVSQRHRLRHFAVKISAWQPMLTLLQRCERKVRHVWKDR